MTPAYDLYPFDLGHKRLNQRAARIVQAALDHPGDSIPTAAGDRTAADATSRFLDTANVVPEELDAAHLACTLRLVADTSGAILVPQATTAADFTSPARARTLGQLAHAKHCGGAVCGVRWPWWIARLGDFLGRKHDGEPGAKSCDADCGSCKRCSSVSNWARP